MAILDSTPIDYSDFDFDSIRARLYNLIASAFPDWTDQTVANFGNILLELMSHVGDTLGFYIDNRARESRLSQATQRASIIAIAASLGYVPTGSTAATVDVAVTLGAVPTEDVVIAAGSVARTRAVTGPVLFQLLEELTIPAGTDPPRAVAAFEHSTTYTETAAATGLANQLVRLTRTPFLDSSEAVSAANGAYTKVTDFLSSVAGDRHYTIAVDSNDKASIRFGNGVTGQVPSGTITVTYKTGGGVVGNVEPGAIAVMDGTFTDVTSTPVTVTVTNAAAASGGASRESRRSIQRNAPASLRTLTRTVSREDYETNAKRVAGVARALMLTSDEYDVILENQGTLYIVPSGGGTASSGLLASVVTMITTTYPRTITFRPTVVSGSYLTIDVQASIHVRKGYTPAAAKAAVVAALTAWFAVESTDAYGDTVQNENIDFGYYLAQNSDGDFDGTLALSDIMNVVRDVASVRKLGDNANDFLVNGSHADLPIAIYQFPKLGTVTVINAETGTPI